MTADDDVTADEWAALIATIRHVIADADDVHRAMRERLNVLLSTVARAALEDGVSGAELGRRLGVSRQAVNGWVRA